MKRDRFQIHYVTDLGNVVSRAEALRIQALERDTARIKADPDRHQPRRRIVAGKIKKLKEAVYE